VSADYQAMGLCLEQHPLALLRPQLDRMGAVAAQKLAGCQAGKTVSVGGMVICRQRPPTAKGFCFISLEDETGISNLVIEPQLFEGFRRELLSAVFLHAEGVLERAGKVLNVKVRKLRRLSFDLTTPDRQSVERVVDRLCS
jgi:error-prone DNA polymerase